MQKEELPFPEKFEGYDYELEDESKNVYTFQTHSGLIYSVIFKPSPYVFNEAIFAPYVYELIIKLTASETALKGKDKRMPYTIYNIFLDFYKRKGDINICLYICDSSDGKQQARARKFAQWFRLLYTGGIIYMGDEIKDLNGTVYPVAVLMNRTNPYRFQIIEAFDNLVTTYSK